MASPINALAWNVSYAFERPNGVVNAELVDAAKKGIISLEIDLLDSDSLPKGPFALKNRNVPARIQIHRTHLELLWAFTYGWMVVYEEAVQKPMIAGSFSGPIVLDSMLKKNAAALLNWASGLKSKYTAWPVGLPSPTQAANEDETSYCQKANGIFQDAVAFLLYHEFAHIRQGHLKDGYDHSDDDGAHAYNKELEREADDFAFRTFISADDGDDVRRLKGWPLLIPVLSSLYLIDGPASVFQVNHPHLHHRIHHVLTQLDFKDEPTRDYYWYLSSVVLTVFAQAHKVDSLQGRMEPEVFDTAPDAFNAQLEELDRLND